MMNSRDIETREEGVIKWDETAKEYGPDFQSIKDKLPKKFIKEFDKNSWFHDFTFECANRSPFEKPRFDAQKVHFFSWAICA